jgi:hypothetical protein
MLSAVAAASRTAPWGTGAGALRHYATLAITKAPTAFSRKPIASRPSSGQTTGNGQPKSRPHRSRRSAASDVTGAGCWTYSPPGHQAQRVSAGNTVRSTVPDLDPFLERGPSRHEILLAGQVGGRY